MSENRFSNERVDFKNELGEFSFIKKLQIQLHYCGQKYMVWVCTRDELDHLVIYYEDLNYPTCVTAETVYEFFVGSMVVTPNRQQRWIFEQYIKEVFSEELAEQSVERAEIAIHNQDEVLRFNRFIYSFQGWLCGQYHAANLERHRFYKMLNNIIGDDKDSSENSDEQG